MFEQLRNFFTDFIQTPLTDGSGDPERPLQLAAAALLVEVSRADNSVDGEEESTIRHALGELFAVGRDEAEQLMALAARRADEAVDYFGFTRLVNDHFDAAQKKRIVELMWRVAFADGHKDDIEEHVVRKIARLLYVPHSDFVHARMLAEQSLKGE